MLEDPKSVSNPPPDGTCGREEADPLATINYLPLLSATRDSRVPQALVGHPRYRVIGLLGAGGMGVVFKAEHLLMDRVVALKVINPELVDSPTTVQRFQREVQAAARLAHPNIVTAFDAEQVGDLHLLVMEYVEGVNLSQVVAAGGPLSVPHACDCIRQAALGLQHAFERGMVHRDVKPHNLLLVPTGQVKVLDFGLARFGLQQVSSGRDATEPGKSASLFSPDGAVGPAALTGASGTMGTPDYVAPEQIRDAHAADIRADIYSLGCTLYFLLSGRAPFQGPSIRDTLNGHLEGVPPSMRDLRRDVPAALIRVLDRMMAKDLVSRFQTPADVAEALVPFAAVPASGRRNRWVVASVLLLSVLGLVGYFAVSSLLFPATGPQSPEQTPRVNPDALAQAEDRGEAVNAGNSPPMRVVPRRGGAVGRGRIVGRVVQGGRPQVGLQVRVLDFQGKEVYAGTTPKDGGFEVTDVAPGRYRILCQKAAERTADHWELTVEANMIMEITLQLRR